jgi:hypothetical protein
MIDAALNLAVFAAPILGIVGSVRERTSEFLEAHSAMINRH